MCWAILSNKHVCIFYGIYCLSFHHPWWRHQMETFAASLAICAGNSPVAVEFPPQRPVMLCVDVFFDLCLNEQLSEQSWGWWFGTPSQPSWRHCNAIVGADGYLIVAQETTIRQWWQLADGLFCKQHISYGADCYITALEYYHGHMGSHYVRWRISLLRTRSGCFNVLQSFGAIRWLLSCICLQYVCIFLKIVYNNQCCFWYSEE